MSTNSRFVLRSNSPLESFPTWMLLKHLNASFQIVHYDYTSLVDTSRDVEINNTLPIFEYLSENQFAVWPTETKRRSQCRHTTHELERLRQLLLTSARCNNNYNIPEILQNFNEALSLWTNQSTESQNGFLFHDFSGADAVSSGIMLLFQSMEASQSIGAISSPTKLYMNKLSAIIEEWKLQMNQTLGNTFQVPNMKKLLSSDQTVSILLASTSAFKIDAGNRGFKGIYPSYLVNIIPVKADSEINSQPVGCEETLRGSINRLNNAKKLHQQTSSMDKIDFILSIENGIVEATPGVWIDLAFVVVEHASSKRTSVATSAGVSFPTSFVDQANKLGFQKFTVGSIMAKAANSKEPNSMDEANPHSYLTKQMKSRSQLLVEAIHIAVGQLIADPISTNTQLISQ